MQYPRVEEITSKKIITLDFNATLKDAIHLITEKGVRNIVVTDKDVDLYAYIGVDEVIKFTALQTPVTTELSKLGLHPLIVIPRRYDVFDASALFIDEISLLGVSNDDGSLFGVISHYDVLSIGAKLSEHIMDSPIETLIPSNNVVLALANDILSDHLKDLSESSLDCIIVHESKIPKGIITKRDITRLLSEEKEIDKPLKNYMSSPLITFSHKVAIKEALASIREHNHKRIIVTNNDKTIHGVITEKALINLIYSRLAHKTAVGIDRFNQVLEQKLQDKANENDTLKQRYELALLASTDGVWDWNLERDELVFSEMWLENFSSHGSICELYSIENLEAMIYEEDKKRWNEIRQLAIENQSSRYEHEYRLNVDGKAVWVKDRAIIIYNDIGLPIRIVSTTANMSENVQLKSTLESYKEMIQRQALYDMLTGVPNRNMFVQELDRFIKNAKHKDEKFILCYLDLDYFKNVNDSYGHIVGDKVMQELAKRIETILGQKSLVARFGGDEFAVLCENVDDAIGAINIVDKLTHLMEEAFEIGEHSLRLSVSIGVTIYPYDGKDANRLLSNATAALNKAKESGRNKYVFYTQDLSKKVYNYMQMHHQMHEAMEKEAFLLYYQPQYDASNAKLSGVEALIRWNDGKNGIVSPDKFIPFLEESGLIVPVGKWVLKSAMQQTAYWYKQGLYPGVVAINVSIDQFKDYMFMDDLKKILQETGCNPAWIELEVTESQVMKNPEQIISILHELKDLGIKLAIDDFGTGHSSLSYLKRLPIDKVKIDRSFVMDLPEHEEDAAIIKAIIVLAKSLSLDIMAEGIESEEQKEFLIKNDCIVHQGFYYAKPLSVELLEAEIL